MYCRFKINIMQRLQKVEVGPYLENLFIIRVVYILFSSCEHILQKEQNIECCYILFNYLNLRNGTYNF